MTNKPLVVDLDGTLLRSDLLVESALDFVRRFPGRFLLPLIWLCLGKVHLKTKLAEYTSVDVTILPYDDSVIEQLNVARQAGRRVVLATASHRRVAEAVAAHLALFDEVLATEGGVNLRGLDKCRALVAKYGEKGYDYIGNSRGDVPVWESAQRAYTVSPFRELVGELGHDRLRSVRRAGLARLPSRRSLVALVGALRLRHWLKNLLVFAPLLAAHQVLSWAPFFSALISFLVFSLCASSGYLFNDLLDLEHDRRHPVKRTRALASGALPLVAGITLVPVLVAIAFAGAWLFLPKRFAIALLVYYALTLMYSMVLKRIVMMDVVVLAVLYTLRIVAGAFAIEIFPSVWLLAFSMFLFLSMALMKRYAELYTMREDGLVKALGRGYLSSDLTLLASFGAASGYLAVLVLALYIQDPHTAMLYRNPELIWLCCPLLLYWMSYLWITTYRGFMQSDPVEFLLQDRVSIFVVALCGLDIWLSV